MAPVDPIVLRNEFVEIALDFFRRFFVRKADFATEPQDVRVDDETGRDSERVPENDVRRFATDAGESDEFFERRRDFSVKALDDSAARLRNVRRFRSVKTSTFD